MCKYDGEANKVLEDRQVKQIAGRAGRYGVGTEQPNAPPAVGTVATLKYSDMELLNSALKTPNEDLTHAFIWPPAAVFHRYAIEFPPNTPLSSIIAKFAEVSQTSNLYRTLASEVPIIIAQAIEEIKGLDLETRYHLTACPVSHRHEEEMTHFLTMVRLLGQNKPITVESHDLNLPLFLVDLKFGKKFENRDYALKTLRMLEMLHKTLIIFSWLSYFLFGRI